ncbi:MAG: lytic murein transglycosylase B [Epsilonproteobacteria bacterium]|nr:MAG: lytic murein transglycosylase B [Campylobacterota bacterium]
MLYLTMTYFIKLILTFILLFTTGVSAKNYLLDQNVTLFIDEMVSQHDFNKTKLDKLFSEVDYQQTALSFYDKSIKPLPDKCKAKKYGTKCKANGAWDRYSHNIVGLQSVKKGKAYMRKHRKTLNRAYKKYGVLPEYIIAIIGIESYYGANVGKYPVFDTLTTLAFEPNRRNKFFKSELKAFLIMTKKEKTNPLSIKGSYAGAIGLGQFMPSNFKKLAVDFDNDGKVSLNDPDDAIGSIAHYLKKSGWKKGQEIAIPVFFFGERYTERETGFRHKYSRKALKKLRPKRATRYNGPIYLIKLERDNHDELWYGTKNFFAITRYNHSNYYAMSVHHLAQKIMGRDVSQPNNMKKGDFVVSDDNIGSIFAPSSSKIGRKFIIEL